MLLIYSASKVEPLKCLGAVKAQPWKPSTAKNAAKAGIIAKLKNIL